MLSHFMYLHARDDRGASLAEYGLLVALIAVIAAGAVGAFGDEVLASFAGSNQTIVEATSP